RRMATHDPSAAPLQAPHQDDLMPSSGTHSRGSHAATASTSSASAHPLDTLWRARPWSRSRSLAATPLASRSQQAPAQAPRPPLPAQQVQLSEPELSELPVPAPVSAPVARR